jgi:hypothetical protein
MPGIVFTFPILTGKVESWRRFCQELAGSRRQPYALSRQRMGILSERMSLVETNYGASAVTTLEATNLDQALSQIISSNLSFDIWYREQLQELYGINLTAYAQFLHPAPTSNNQELIFEWNLNSNKPKYS